MNVPAARNEQWTVTPSTLLGWVASIVLQPLGEPALRLNLLSALLQPGCQ